MLPCIHKLFFRKGIKNKYIMIKPLPRFPEFRLFTIDDILWYRDFYYSNSLNPYADICPDNLFIWLNFNDDLQVSKLDDTIMFRYSNIFDNNQINIIPLSNSLNDSVTEKIMTYLNENNLPLEIHEVPSIICDKLDHKKWLVKDDKNSFEYLLDTNQQTLLEGSDFSHQRNRIASFEREHLNDIIEVKYYKEFYDSDSIEDAILEDMWEYVADKYGIDFDIDKYKNLKSLIEYYLQENFPFYTESRY